MHADWPELSDLLLDVDPETLLVAVDQLLMHRVVANLLENAVRHGAAPFRVTASLGPAQAGDRTSGPIVTLAVSDGGPGIAPEDAAKVFERFARLDRSRRSGGSGLGLAIVAAIVGAHRGQYGVSSVPGQGSVFWFELPT